MSEKLKKAAKNADWQQVVLNGGPPCFHLSGHHRFCLRAERWDGHKAWDGSPAIHEFVSLETMLRDHESALQQRIGELEAGLRETITHLECVNKGAGPKHTAFYIKHAETLLKK